MRAALPYRTLTALGATALTVVLSAHVIACGEDAADPTASATADAGSSTLPTEPPEAPGFGPATGTDAGDAGGASECTKMDIVFVVDNSSSMSQEQKNLAANFPKFGAIIDGYKTGSGQSLDYRLAVTTTDFTSNKGKFITKGASKGCDSGPARPWLEPADGSVSAFFSCRAEVGISGSASERPLGSLLLGLNERIADGTNTMNGESFLREDALLAFVAITDEDELLSGNGSSNTLPKTIEEYPARFDKVKGGERGRWASAIIAGQQACSSSQLGSAKEAKNLKAFASSVGQNAVFSSICSGDLTEGLTKALDTFGLACKSFPSGPR